MADPIVIRVEAGGVTQLLASFKTIEQAVIANERVLLGATEKGARERQRVTERASKEREKLIGDGVKATERAGSEETRAHDRAEREKTRAAEQWSRRRQQIQDNSARMAGQIARQQAEAEIRELQRVHDTRERFARAIGGHIVGGARAGISAVIGGAGRVMSGVMQIGGGFSIADSVQRTMEMQRSAALLSNSAIGVNGITAADADPAKIMARARAASITTGVDANDLIRATRGYVAKSSDFKGGMANMEFFGQLAKGTGTDIGEVANAAGIIRSQNKGLDAKGMNEMLLAVVQQGKQGSVEIEDLAKSAGKITRSATSYAGDQSTNQQKLLGLSQIAIRTAGSTDSAAIALSALGTDTRNQSKGISKALGYNVLDAGGKIVKSPEELVADIMGATGGNLKALGQKGGLGFTKPTMKLFEALKPDFDKAQAEYLKAHPGDMKGANAAGRKASLAEMTGITGQTLDAKELDAMVKRMMDTPAERLEAAFRQLRDSVGNELVPELVKLIPVLRDATPMFMDLIRAGVKFAEWFKDNPIKGIGAVILASITKDLAAAAIGEAVKAAIVKIIGGGSVPVPGGGGAGGAPIGKGVAMGVATGAVVANAMLGYEGGQNLGQDLAAKVKAWQRGDRERGISPEAAKAQLDAAKQRLDKTGVFDQVGNIISSPVSETSDKAYKQYKADQGLTDSKELIAALKEVAITNKQVAAANKGGGAVGGGGGAGTPGSTDSPSRNLPMSARP